MRLLLLSNSTNYRSGYLDHAVEAIRAHFSGLPRILFVPFALKDQEGYHARARKRFADFGIDVDRLQDGPEGAGQVEKAEGIFVGGGNTFRLLARLQRSGLVEPIRRRVLEGMPYMGSSAGTGIAAPTLMTTNDMPIVRPASFDSLGLVPLQINCHYVDADAGSTHMGETREDRLREFLEENPGPIVGLREGAMLKVETDGAPGATGTTMTMRLLGAAGARIFFRDAPPEERGPGASLDDLLPRPCRPPLMPRAPAR